MSIKVEEVEGAEDISRQREIQSFLIIFGFSSITLHTLHTLHYSVFVSKKESLPKARIASGFSEAADGGLICGCGASICRSSG
jgi:hypothetical protein